MTVESNHYAIPIASLGDHTLYEGFSRASSKLQGIARNSDWFIALLAPVVIGCSNYFGSGFSKLTSKALSHG